MKRTIMSLRSSEVVAITFGSALVAALLGWMCGCGGSAATAARDGGSDSSFDSGPGEDAGPATCGTIAASDLPASAVPAMGTVVGAGVDAVTCPNGAWSRVAEAGSPSDTSPLFLYLGSTVGNNTSPDFVFHTPVGASQGELNAAVGIDSTDGGDYSSVGGRGCATVTFTYYVPAPSSVNCDAGASAQRCPAGCGRICPVSGCDGIPCVPAPQARSYVAYGPTGCLGDAGEPSAAGSWDLSLQPTASEASSPHGHLGATLVGVDAASESTTLSLTF